MFYYLSEGFFASDVTCVNITKTAFLFASNQAHTESIIYCLLYSFLSMSIFVFKTFLRCKLFMITLFIFLFMKDAWFAWYYHFLEASLWIASSMVSSERSNSRFLFLLDKYHSKSH